MKLDELKELLERFRINYNIRDYSLIYENIKTIKKIYLDIDDERTLKKIWELETVTEIQEHYISAFQLIKSKKYYEGWCELEKSENNILSLRKYFKKDYEKYSVPYIKTQVEKLQGLFPYRLFLSPEILIHKSTCSICGEVISLNKGCHHELGEIYRGEMCGRTIEDAEILAVAFVENPVQKFSVMFDDQDNPEKYLVLNYFNDLVEEPFEGWGYEIKKVRKPHSIYRKIGRNAKCPCNSGKKYKNCCLNEGGVLSDHYVLFKEKNSDNMTTINMQKTHVD